jgi:hypothetical protein
LRSVESGDLLRGVTDQFVQRPATAVLPRPGGALKDMLRVTTV